MYRDRRTLFLVVPVLAFLLVATSLYLNRGYVSRVVLPKLHLPSSGSQNALISQEPAALLTSSTSIEILSSSSVAVQPLSTSTTPVAATPQPTSSSAVQPLPTPNIGNGTVLQATIIKQYIEAILDPASATFDRMQCPPLNETRYAPMTKTDRFNTESDRIEYFFALNLRNNLSLLPRLLGSIVEAIQYLGKERCALSIVEGNSPDGTADVLDVLASYFDPLNIEYYYSTSDINPKKGHRIERLARLRNLALDPLFNASEGRVTHDTTVLFINDVAACSEDILELALQRDKLGADMTCAVDWTFVGEGPTFYDVWISRTVKGDSFFRIPSSGSWDFAWDLFWNDAETKARFSSHKPFQVYSCWNGAVAFTAAPLLEGVRFRDAKKGHCKHGEPQNLCKDLWARGYGKIAVIPTVHLEYSNKKGTQIKRLKGYVSELVSSEKEEDNAIEWVGPPEKVRCIESWGHQFWKPWKVSRRNLEDDWRE